ncbi:putative MFS family arabinose efflux permease [Hamadaea flava]|uniref:MFS transporter n=1 Tax=Hamadaea flava TaxID=1742688 RepID=A0ABV8LMV6_9ACTN|nr:MFS transporter [Hamadaea flava]MCP2323277.1 putative MFS family arabinose efflux permease [Hamadaea flava]
MSTTLTPATTRTGGGRARPRRLVAVFAVTQTIGYGVLYYTFSVLLAPIAADLHSTAAHVTIALTVSVLAAAGAAIPVGRWLDRHGGRALMTAGSLLGVLAVAAWSQVRTLTQLYAVFAAIGLASAMSLYDAAFSVLIAVTDPAHRDGSLLAVTVVAGFASSIFFPLTAALTEALGWRTALLALAGLLAATAVPAHLAAVPSRSVHAARARNRHGRSAREAFRDNGFWLLAAAFVLHTAAVSSVSVLLVIYLRQAGHPATVAASLAGLLGVLSVTGRLTTTALARRHGMTTVTAAIFTVQAFGAAALPYLGPSLAGAAACVIAFGIGFGVATIARPAIVAHRYGTARYATIAASLTLPTTLAKAGAPLTAALLTPARALPLAGLFCLISAALLYAAGRRPPGSTHTKQ